MYIAKKKKNHILKEAVPIIDLKQPLSLQHYTGKQYCNNLHRCDQEKKGSGRIYQSIKIRATAHCRLQWLRTGPNKERISYPLPQDQKRNIFLTPSKDL